uniref:Uncharacterized protein n=1 Tax=Picea glauca TaxID=3330 RepID=A0A101M496_PICGL|nr:hypothetical protein ABT39_MTgene569 [Picea glauca]
MLCPTTSNYVLQYREKLGSYSSGFGLRRKKNSTGNEAGNRIYIHYIFFPFIVLYPF